MSLAFSLFTIGIFPVRKVQIKCSMQLTIVENSSPGPVKPDGSPTNVEGFNNKPLTFPGSIQTKWSSHKTHAIHFSFKLKVYNAAIITEFSEMQKGGRVAVMQEFRIGERDRMSCGIGRHRIPRPPKPYINRSHGQPVSPFRGRFPHKSRSYWRACAHTGFVRPPSRISS